MTRAAEQAPARTPWALYTALTLIVWGAFALDRGLWHDEVQILFRALAAPQRGEGWFPVLASPTRRLLAWPSFVALASGAPRLVLELLSGASWLLTGVLAERLSRRLWPGQPCVAYLAAVLTLTATSDFFTDALVGLGYQLLILAYLAAVAAGFAWVQEARRAWLVLACTALVASLFTGDAAAPAWLLTPWLWAVAVPRDDAGARRRLRTLAVAWYVVALPYLVVLAQAFATPGSYVQGAFAPLTWQMRAARLADTLAWNFEPWGWAFGRPLWLPPVGRVIPLEVQLALAAASGVLVAWGLFARHGERPAPDTRLRWSALLVVVLLMVVSNAAFAGVHLAQFFCRTHLLSRVFASLALGAVLGWGWSRAAGRRARVALGASVALWIGLGSAGGLERQDYFTAYARAHRQELRSILGAAPGLAPDARLLLRVPASEHYLATEAGYLARAWAALLYQDPGVECRVFLWSTPRGTVCAPHAGGLECRGERSPDCRRADGRDVEWLPYERLVFLEYVARENRYVLRDELPADARPSGGPTPARYAPRSHLVPRAPTPLARDLVHGPEGLAAWLWPPT